ncbi:fidgetin-like protein [Acrasis kona]|uniref:Fidgetin-like protein n=1 Tax=Acrasis kona TaxID=1008807 RepID=A0AAW2ZSV5_9EUKA
MNTIHTLRRCTSTMRVFIKSTNIVPNRSLHTTQVYRQHAEQVAIDPKGKTTSQLQKLYWEAFKPTVLNICLEDGYTPYDPYNLILGKPELREKMLKAASFRFGREIPSSHTSSILTVKQLISWHASHASPHKAPSAFYVPQEVSNFIANNLDKRKEEVERREKNKKENMLKAIGAKRFKLHFGNAFSKDEVKAAIKILEKREAEEKQKLQQVKEDQ